jgi:arylformamidase
MGRKVFDISLTVSTDMPVWPGDPAVELRQVASMEAGAQANVSHLCMGVHTGTHVDAPHHFLNDSRTVEQLSLEVLTGSCYVAQLSERVEMIDVDVLSSIALPVNTSRILFGTRNSRLWQSHSGKFSTEFVAVNAEAALWLVDKGIRLVGVDYLSVAPYGDSVRTHTALLEAGVIVVEGLNLSEIESGIYQLYCLPLKLKGADGAPARAILVQN